MSFENAITAVRPPARRVSQRSPRRLLFYARPEPHAARNMFELGVLGLARALADGAFAGDWEFNGIGSTRRGRVALGRTSMRLLPRSDQSAYAELLRDHDVGLALMYTPHPSLVPIEMAAAGMVVVTNRFENKDAAAMARDLEQHLRGGPDDRGRRRRAWRPPRSAWMTRPRALPAPR